MITDTEFTELQEKVKRAYYGSQEAAIWRLIRRNIPDCPRGPIAAYMAIEAKGWTLHLTTSPDKYEAVIYEGDGPKIGEYAKDDVVIDSEPLPTLESILKQKRPPQ